VNRLVIVCIHQRHEIGKRLAEEEGGGGVGFVCFCCLVVETVLERHGGTGEASREAFDFNSRTPV
jgi:hypothetical protein